MGVGMHVPRYMTVKLVATFVVSGETVAVGDEVNRRLGKGSPRGGLRSAGPHDLACPGLPPHHSAVRHQGRLSDSPLLTPNRGMPKQR